MVAGTLPTTSLTTSTVATLVHLLLLSPLVGAGFLETPSSLTVTAAEPARLECRVSDPSSCHWTVEGRPLEASPPRVALTSCSLAFSHTLPSDGGEYVCLAGPQPSPPATLRVVAPPGVPHITQGRHGEVLEVARGVALQLDCQSLGGQPPAELEWRMEGVGVNRHQVTEHVKRIGESQTWRTISTFTFHPQEVTRVTCEATSAQFPSPKVSQPLEVRVRFRPRVEVMVNQDVVREGDSFEVSCKSRAFPQEVGYKWFFNGAELENEVNNTLLVEEINRMYNDADISCLVENEEGLGEGSTSLDVHYAPTILLHPRSQIARRKDNVTFHCVAEGNPVPQYLWTRGRQESLVQAGKQNLSLVATEKTEATYRCQVFSDGNELVKSLPASLILIRKPRIGTESSVTGTVDQDLVLTCTTESVSNRTKIVWLRRAGPDLQPLDTSGERFRVSERRAWRLQQSDLIIRKMESKDFGLYGCFAENEVGTDMAQIEVAEAATNFLTLIVGITVLIGILLILAIFLYVRIKRACGQGKY